VAQQASSQPAADYQRRQALLASALAVQVDAAFTSLLVIGDLRASLPVLSAGVAALVQRYGSASAGIAASYYDQARAAAAVKGAFHVVPASPAGLDQVTQSVRFATRTLWSSRPDTAPAKAMTRAVAERHVMDAGRDTITAAVAGDRQARGWARVTRPGCCYFCAMLATRGGAYLSKQSAEFKKGTDEPYHDHCHCVPEPVFGAYEMTADARAWQALWRSSTKGLSGDEAVKAFRQAFEGRD
jgi:hypothetical protein